jgi:periplasmic protein TonB
VNQRRSSFVVISVTVHATILVALLATSIFAPGVLPVPKTLFAWAPERVVQAVDITLPSPPLARARAVSSSPSPIDDRPENAAPIEPARGIAPETGRESIAAATISSVAAIERGIGSVDGIGVAENPPAAPPTAATLQEPRRLHQGIQAPRKTMDVAPKYPTLARESHVEGIVILDVIIDEHGSVTSTRVLRSVALLDQAAIDAVRQWRFTPARLNGEAIPIVMTVTVTFRLQ